ncbi:MAG: hypothetical protein ABSH28_10550 [Acidobacteriota bacterium]
MIITIQLVWSIAFHADEQVQVAVVVEISPAVRLTTGDPEQVGLNRFEVRLGGGWRRHVLLLGRRA